MKKLKNLNYQIWWKKLKKSVGKVVTKSSKKVWPILQSCWKKTKNFTTKVVWPRLKALPTWAQIVALGLVGLSLGLSVILMVNKRSEEKMSGPEFKRQLFGPYAYASKNGPLTTRLGHDTEGVRLSVENDTSQIEFKTPLTKISREKKDEQLVFETENKLIKVSYRPLKNGVKEEIILSGDPNTNQFASTLSVKGVEPRVTAEGQIIFVNSEGEYQYHLQEPWAKDSTGDVTYGLSYKIYQRESQDKELTQKTLLSPLLATNNKGETTTKTSDFENTYLNPTTDPLTGNINYSKQLLGGINQAQEGLIKTKEYVLVLEVDSEWLNSPDRVYPLTIDPTVVHDESSEFSSGELNRVTDTGSGASPQLESYYQELPADEHTVGLWHMNNDWTDASGNGNNGTAAGGATFSTSAKLGSHAGSFDGTDDYVNIPNSVTLNSSGHNLTIEAWFQLDSLQTGERSIVRKDTQWQLGIFPSDGAIRCLLATSGTTGWTGANDENYTFTTNKWYHLAFTYNGSVLKIFVNGQQVGSDKTVTGNISTNTNNIAIGSNTGGSILNLDASIDEVRISNIARTPEEIKAAAQRRPSAVYTSDVIDLTKVYSWNDLAWTENGVLTGDGETLADSTDLVAHWKFNETNGTTADNAAGSCGASCDGTLTNFTLTGSQDQHIIEATGGTITKTDGYTIHTFTSSGTFTPSTNMNVEALVVAGGGGGGGDNGGGGGAGGVVYDDSLSVSAQAYTVTVGDGGAAGSINTDSSTNGGNSSFSSITAIGGGKGATGQAGNSNAGNGGSGGGGDGERPTNGGSGTVGQGYAGGNGDAGGAGGGGGAGEPGDNGSGAYGGDGGDGVAYDISGTSTYYGGGGGGGNNNGVTGDASGGLGGGGDAGINTASPGTANTGGGGGGATHDSSSTGGVGGSGIVIIRYPSNPSGWTSDNGRWPNSNPGALMFDGSDDYVDLGNDTSLDLTDDFSMSAWIKQQTNNDGYIVSKNTSNDSHRYYGLYSKGSTDTVHFYYETSGGRGQEDWSMSDIILDDSNWHYVTAVIDYPNVELFIDGQSQGTQTLDGTLLSSQSTDVWIGKRKPDDFQFNGVMDSISIYSRPLSAEEILANYNSNNLQFQTRVGNDTSPDDGDWTDWSPSTSETQIKAFDNQSSSWQYRKPITITNGGTAQTDFQVQVKVDTASLITAGKLESDCSDIRFTNDSGEPLPFYQATACDAATTRFWVKVDNIATPSETIYLFYGNSGVESASNRDQTFDISYLGTFSQSYSDANIASNHGASSDRENNFYISQSTYVNRFNTSWTYQQQYASLDIYTGLCYDDKEDRFYGVDWTNKQWSTFTTGFTETSPNDQALGGSPIDCATDSEYIYTNHRAEIIQRNKISDNSSSVINMDALTEFDWGGQGLTYAYGYLFAGTTDSYGSNGNRIYVIDIEDWENPQIVTYWDASGHTLTEVAGLTWMGKYLYQTDRSIDSASEWQGPVKTAATEPIVGAPGTEATYASHSGSWIESIANWDKSLKNLFTSVASSTIKQEGDGSNQIISGQIQADSSTVGLWHLDETNSDLAGNDVFDATNNNNDGELNGTNIATTVVDGVIGKAREFNGTDDYIQVADSNSLDTSGNGVTLEAWVKPHDCTGTGDGRQTIVTKEMAYYLNLESGTCKPEFYWYSLSSPGYHIANNALPLNQWSHVAATYDGSRVRIFINGKLDKVVGGLSGTGTINTDYLYIGGRDGNRNFDGAIDEVRVSNRARSETEIAEIHRLGREQYLTQTISSTDLSNKESLPFYVAADRPGSYLTATVGESDYANYQPDENTAGLWHLEDNRYRDDASNNHGITSYYGIEYGIRDSNLTLTANQYTGTANNGEIDITCPGGDTACEITTLDGTTLSTPSIDSGVAMQEAAAVSAFIMYSPSLSAQSITPLAGNSDNFVGIRYTGNTWQYDNNTAWVDFIPNKSNIIIASLTTGNPTVTSLLQLDIHPNPTQGVIGEARDFNGTNDCIQGISSNEITGDNLQTISFSLWFKTDSTAQSYISSIKRSNSASTLLSLEVNQPSAGYVGFLGANSSSTQTRLNQYGPYNDNQWHHLAAVIDNSTRTLYIDGQKIASDSDGLQSVTGNTFPFSIGCFYINGGNLFFDGSVDEVNVSRSAMSATEIRQAYEIGKRTHPITIDFAASLDSGNLITNSGDTSFTVDATSYGLSEMGSNLYLGDKIIVKENYGGTEYLAQGTVTSVTPSTGAVTISSWDTGSTFPTSGFTADASVFKWQREYFDLSGALDSHIDAVTNLTLRFTNGHEGRTVYLDDLRSAGDYSTDPTGSTLTSPTYYRYLQYRTILTSSDPAVSASLDSVTLDYVENSAPSAPTSLLTEGQTNPTGITDTIPEFSAIYNDSNTSDVANKYQIQVDDNSDFSSVFWDSGASGTSMSDCNKGSRCQDISYGGSALAEGTTYYWRIKFWDQAGSEGTWSTGTNTFDLNQTPSAPTSLLTEGQTNPTGLTDTTPEFSAIYNDGDSGDTSNKYQIQVDDNSDFSSVFWDSGSSGTSMSNCNQGDRCQDISYGGSALTEGQTYYWRIKFWDQDDYEGAWSVESASFTINKTPNIPTLNSPLDEAIQLTTTPTFKTTSTDDDNDYLQYKIVVCEDGAMTSNCQTFDQTSSQTGWSGQDAGTGTAYTSGTQASYTVQDPLPSNTTLYWKTYALDPAGTNTWSDTQTTPRSFTTLYEHASECTIEEATDDSSLTLNWSDNSGGELGYEIKRSVNGGAYTTLTTKAANSTSHVDNTVSQGNTYQYQIAPYWSGPVYSEWCTTAPARPLSLQSGHFYID